jgi:DNA-directed RNA polymerase subunit RPC12/RpoP
MHKGYKCNHCWKLYLRDDLLQKHNELVHPDGIQCHLCPKTFSRNDKTANHYRERHGDDEEDDEWLLKTVTEKEPIDDNVVMD